MCYNWLLIWVYNSAIKKKEKEKGLKKIIAAIHNDLFLDE
jgi:hypothetical protein